MPRPKKPVYEYVPSRGAYRKRIKDSDGKYVALYAKTPEELTEKVELAQAQIADLVFRRENPTFREYAEKWLSLYTADMKPKNREQHLNAVNLHIVPIIGDKFLDEVKPDDARLVVLAMNGKSSSLQSKVIGTMKKIFETAVDNGLIQKNPCAKLKNSGYRTKQKIALSDAQVKVLLDAVRNTRAEPFVMLGLYTGMRREEILALQWDCVHLPKGKTPYVTVKRALRWEHNQPVTNDILKSDASYRTIPIPSCLSEYLVAIKKPKGYVIGGDSALTQTQFKNLWAIITRRQVGDRTYRASRIEKVTKVTFTRQKGEKSRGGDFRYTIDFPVFPHILRHTYITNLLLSGTDPKSAQYLAGHADSHLTLDIYTHLVDKSPQKMLTHVQRAFEVQTEVQAS